MSFSTSLLAFLVDGNAEHVTEQMIDQAAQHGLAGIVLQKWQSQPRLAKEPDLIARLRRSLMQQAAAGMKVKRLLFQVLQSFAQQGLNPILLKGYGLAARVYPEPLARPTSDVDVLVLPEEVDRAIHCLKTLGLSPKVDSDEYYPMPYRHHWAMVGPAGLVELHYQPMTAFGIAWPGLELFPRAVESTLESVSVRYLKPEDELVFLSLHAANHMLQRLGWVYDLKLFINAHPSLDWNEVVRLATEEAHMPYACYYSLKAARSLLGVEVPEETLRALRPSWLRRKVSEWAFSERSLVNGTLSRRKGLWAGVKFLLSDSRWAMVMFSVRRLFWNIQKKRQVPTAKRA